jgi:hypothetical protein
MDRIRLLAGTSPFVPPPTAVLEEKVESLAGESFCGIDEFLLPTSGLLSIAICAPSAVIASQMPLGCDCCCGPAGDVLLAEEGFVKRPLVPGVTNIGLFDPLLEGLVRGGSSGEERGSRLLLGDDLW